MKGFRLQAVIAFVIFCPLAGISQPASQEPALPSPNGMLDSIPTQLFHKMFRSHKLVGSPGLAWKKQRVITVAFYQGSNDLYELIEQTAEEWTALGGQLSFSFKDDAGHYRHWMPNDKSPVANIRIAFQKGGYWSLLGVLAKNVDPGDPTMNFERFPDDLQRYFHGQNAADWRTSYAHTTILHEFGHAIGLSHEHFNSQCQKDLRLDAIISYLMGPPNNWSQEQARFNMDAQYYAQILAQQAGPVESKLITSSAADQLSVMLYVFPVSYYKSGDKSICKPIGDHGQVWPTTLSDGDKQFYLANYQVIPSPFGGASAVKGVKDECSGQIAYKSDKDDAYKYLEGQQRQIYAQNPHLTDPYSKEELKSPHSVNTFTDLRARAVKACPDPSLRSQCALDPNVVDRLMRELGCMTLPTRFESPLFIALINLDTKLVDKVRVSHFPQSLETRFGSLATGTFDAQAILPPGSKIPLVILNRDIFFFTGALSKAISDSIPITVGNRVSLDYSESGIRTRLHDHPYIVQNFADAMSRLVREGSSAGAVEVTLDENHNHIHARLVTAMDLFLISHEQAHVILSHVSDQAVDFRLAGSHYNRTSDTWPKVSAHASQTVPLTPNSPADGPVTTLKAELRTREQELQADALGFKLMIWSEQEKGDPVATMMAAAAPHMVFRVLDAANAYGSEAGGWIFSDANHPSAADRIQALSPVFDEVAKTSEPLGEADFRIPFDAAFKALLAEADPLIRKNLGLPPKKLK